MDVKILTSKMEECQGCGQRSDPATWSHSPWFCDTCYIERVYQQEKLQELGILCCGLTDPGPRGEPGEPGEPGRASKQTWKGNPARPARRHKKLHRR